MPDALVSFISVFAAAAAALFVLWLLARRWRLRAVGSKSGELRVAAVVALDSNWRAAVVVAGGSRRYLALYGPGGACLQPLGDSADPDGDAAPGTPSRRELGEPATA